MTHPLIAAARPRTLPAAIAPVLVGTAAAGSFIAWRMGAAIVVALAIQIGVNYANDLYDAAGGVDTEARVGPQRAVASGLVSPGAMRTAMIAAFLVAGAAGLTLAAAVGWELLLVGAAAFAAAIAYSGGPRPYASRGLGEIFVFVFFGLVATIGSAYVQEETITRLAYVSSIPIGLLATAILVVNNLRDIGSDAAAGKMTLAVRIGARRTRLLYEVLVAVAFLATAAAAAAAGSFLPLLALLAIPFAVTPLLTVIHSDEPPELIAALGGTARLELIYAVLLAVGLWAS